MAVLLSPPCSFPSSDFLLQGAISIITHQLIKKLSTGLRSYENQSTTLSSVLTSDPMQLASCIGFWVYRGSTVAEGKKGDAKRSRKWSGWKALAALLLFFWFGAAFSGQFSVLRQHTEDTCCLFSR